MKVAVFPADEMGCGHSRLIFPANALIAQGHDVVIDRVGPTIEWSENWSGRRMPPASCHVVKCRPYEAADVVVMQRAVRQHFVELIPHLQKQGIRVVVDVDDLLDSIDKRNIAWKDHQAGGRFAAVAHSWLDEACKRADLVSVTTPALLKRYGFGHGIVLPNLVPESYLSVFGLKRPETIGWSGFVATHPGDLQATQGAVSSSMAGEWSFHVIGSPDAVRRDLGLRCEPTSTGKVEFIDYAAALAEIEIGIVPLGPGAFNEAKSALKASEMAAVGVPVVMSPTPDNLRLNRLGIGLIAESRGQWKRHLTRLVGSVDARYEMAEQGREIMSQNTYEIHAERWLEAWTERVLVAA